MKSKLKHIIGCLFLIFLFIAAFARYGKSDLFSAAKTVGREITADTVKPESSQFSSGSSNDLRIHFIDVGQGDSELIESNGHYMLVDAGEGDKGDIVVDYLQKLGVTQLDYVIGTHPHSDHIGGLEEVIKSFQINEIMMPAKEHTTPTSKCLLKAIEHEGLTLTTPAVGGIYELGNASFQIISPNKDYGDDLNNWSIGIKIRNGKNAFVMCGDAENGAEMDMCSNELDIGADVLKLSHHGSSTSSSESFLDKVHPAYAVISCEIGNIHGHPDAGTMEKLKERNIQIYRTDEMGTVIASSDGETITWNKPPDTDYAPGIPFTAEMQDGSAVQNNGEIQNGEAQEYILNTKSLKFHYPDCPSVKKMMASNKKKYRGTRNDLIDNGYAPCKYCSP